jgi:hypothetical protein
MGSKQGRRIFVCACESVASVTCDPRRRQVYSSDPRARIRSAERTGSESGAECGEDVGREVLAWAAKAKPNAQTLGNARTCRWLQQHGVDVWSAVSGRPGSFQAPSFRLISFLSFFLVDGGIDRVFLDDF